jgi:hypothetical protein
MPKSKNTRPPSARASVQPKIEAERRRLMKASAILTGAGIAAGSGVDGEVVSDVIAVAAAFVDQAVVALDSVNLTTTTAEE